MQANRELVWECFNNVVAGAPRRSMSACLSLRSLYYNQYPESRMTSEFSTASVTFSSSTSALEYL